MKKILILANSSGGLYDFRNELVLRLLKSYEVVVSLPDDVRTRELAEEGCRVIHTAINRRGVNPKEDISLLLSYRRLIQDEKPDLVLTYTIKPNIYGGFCSRMARVPYVETVTGLGSSFEKKGLFLHMIVAMYRTALKKAECIFFQNEENRQIFESYHIRGKQTKLVSGSGVNLKRHTMEPYPEGDTTVFLYVGRMMREKGIEELLAAAEALHSEKIQFWLLGYPDEDYEEKLQKAEKEGCIRLLPFDPDVHGYLAKASALVLPSYHEGMSNVLLEAAATGRPVITSNIPGCRESVENGKSGLLVEVKNKEMLYQAMKKMLHCSREEREKMGKAGREKMKREFRKEAVVERTVRSLE